MRQLLIEYLFVSLIAGLWLSLNEAQPRVTIPICYNTSSGQTCFTTFLASKGGPVRKSFKEASQWCETYVPGSSLIIVDSLKKQRDVEGFIGRNAFANETIFTDAQKLKQVDRLEWSWINGNRPIPGASSVRYQRNNKSYSVGIANSTWFDARKECSRFEGDLISYTDLQTMQNWSWLQRNQKYWIGLVQNKWIWKSTGVALTYANWEGGYPDQSVQRQCACIQPRCKREKNRTVCDDDRKWGSCNCNNSYPIVCQKESSSAVPETPKSSQRTTIIDNHTSPNFKSTERAEPSTSIAATSTRPTRPVTNPTNATSKLPNKTDYTSNSTTTMEMSTTQATTETITTSTTGTSTTTSRKAIMISTTTTTKKPITTTQTTKTTTTKPTSTTKTTPSTTTLKVTPSTSTAKPTVGGPSSQSHPTSTQTLDDNLMNKASTDQTITFQSGEKSGTTKSDLFSSFSTIHILLIVLLFVAVIFIIVTVVVVTRKCKFDKRNDGSPPKNTSQPETFIPVYASVTPVNRPPAGSTHPPGKTISTGVELTALPTPSNNAIYASVQPSGKSVDIGKTVVYADLDLLSINQHKQRSADKIAACLSPIYSQPFEPPSSTNNTEYAEPFIPGKRSTATAPVVNHYENTADQTNIYSLATAIPTDDPKAVYSEPRKKTK